MLDVSSSMDTRRKRVWSRALATAVLRRAAELGARVFFRMFEFYPIPPDKPITEYREALSMVLRESCGGGTDIDAAIRAALLDIERLGAPTTILLITDGEDRVDTRPEELIRRRATLVAAMVEGDNPTLARLARLSGGEYLSLKPDRSGALTLIRAVEKSVISSRA